ncbi:hypothetical protein LTR56_013825 [Elasticomyces elasticus]|nr:hypothetical protein LTR56_013825 [Elasticomyces elasticus]KAK3660570.1 hypothetical protein LTR22_008011 [Elasticomyces elasticus]KAK4923816.1 hypothetical protein LTR49_008964 [Elasticomyces elasticus]KAK5752001.1 hypothetical protein LTS12_017934 [Elasticomyces elasticus]
MVIFKKPSAPKVTSTISIPPPGSAVATTQKSIQWSDITASDVNDPVGPVFGVRTGLTARSEAADRFIAAPLLFVLPLLDRSNRLDRSHRTGPTASTETTSPNRVLAVGIPFGPFRTGSLTSLITAGRESTHPNVISDRVKRFFAVFEICEDILDHLGRKDLFRAQFICHIFKDTIAESSKLGRKLFVKPALAKQTLRWATTAGGFESRGRLLAGSKAASALQEQEDTDTDSPGTSEVESPRIQSIQPYVLNPFLFHLHPSAKSKTVLDTAQEFVAGKLAGTYSLGLTLNKDAYALTTAMSQDMYITQPPVKEVCLLLRKLCSHLVCNHDNYHRHCEGIRGLDPYPCVRNEEGVTFGQVLQVAAPYLNRARHGTLKYIQVVDGLPVTMVEKEFVEAAGEVTEETNRIRRNIMVSRAKGETQHRKRSGGRATR